jgi:hypothetical protein
LGIWEHPLPALHRRLPTIKNILLNKAVRGTPIFPWWKEDTRWKLETVAVFRNQWDFSKGADATYVLRSFLICTSRLSFLLEKISLRKVFAPEGLKDWRKDIK